jgi:hypothetical protein
MNIFSSGSDTQSLDNDQRPDDQINESKHMESGIESDIESKHLARDEMKIKIQTIAMILNQDPEIPDPESTGGNFQFQSRDFVNDKKQRSETRDSDRMILRTLYCIGVGIDTLALLIQSSDTECWNQHIIASSLNHQPDQLKTKIVQLLTKSYDTLVSPDGKSHRSEDMQRIMSLYPYNIRLQDLGGFFEKVTYIHQAEKEEDLEPDYQMIRNKFQTLPRPEQSYERICLFVPNGKKNVWLNFDISETQMITRLWYENRYWWSDDLIDSLMMIGHGPGAGSRSMPSESEIESHDGKDDEKWLELEVLINLSDPLTNKIIDWLRKQDIFLTIQTTQRPNVGNTWIMYYYTQLIKLLKRISNSKPDIPISISDLPSFSNHYEPDAWFLMQAEGDHPHTHTGDSDAEDEVGNKIHHYVYQNHIVNNVYRLDVGVANYGNPNKYLWWALSLNECLKESESDSESESDHGRSRSLLSKRLWKDSMNENQSICVWGISHQNEIVMTLIDFLASQGQNIGSTHRYVIKALCKLTD